jgi:hypothetical protein
VWNTAADYAGNTPDTRLGDGPKGHVVLECYFNNRIGVIVGRKNSQGESVNKQWLFHPLDLAIHKYHFVCTEAAANQGHITQLNIDVDPFTSTLSGKERRKRKNLMVQATEYLSDTCRLPPRIHRRKYHGSIIVAKRQKTKTARRLRRRIAAKMRASALYSGKVSCKASSSTDHI